MTDKTNVTTRLEKAQQLKASLEEKYEKVKVLQEKRNSSYRLKKLTD